MPEGRTTTEEMEWRWAECLDELRCRMSQASFGTWLQDSRPLAWDGEALTVGIVHGSGAQWMEHRFLPALRDILERYFPGLTAVQARPLHDAAGGGETRDPPSLRSGQSDSLQSGEKDEEQDEEEDAIEVEAVTDPALARFDVSQAGWSKLANYALDFWAELLGPTAFLTWLAIRHEDIRRIKTEWTPVMSFSVNHLAAIAAGGNRQAVTGVWRTCRAASMVQRDEPCPQCRARGGERVAPHSCRYWRPGALDRLQAEGVAIVERRGQGLQVTYRVRVFTLLPLLTPVQVALLGPNTQQRHNRWLLRQGLDPASWERLTVRHLALPPL